MALEDFTTYNEIDTIVDVTAAKIQRTWMDDASTSYVYKDKGAAFFNADFTHKFVVNHEVDENGNGGYWFMSNNIDNIVNHQTNLYDCFLFYYQGQATNAWELFVVDGGDFASLKDTATVGTIGTDYYVTITLDIDAGANGTGQLVATIRTGSHTGDVADTLTVDCPVGWTTSFRYIYGWVSDSENQNNDLHNGFTSNLDLGSGEEDFTTYTRVAPTTNLTVTANRIVFNDVERQNPALVWADKGAGFFSGDFTHQVEFSITAHESNGAIYPWALTNQVRNIGDVTNGVYILCYDNAGTGQIYFEEYTDGAPADSSDGTSLAYSLSTTYYLTITRVGAVYTCTIRTGSHEGTVVDTLTFTSSAVAFRYIYGMSTNLFRSAVAMTGQIDNLNLSAGFTVTTIGNVEPGNISTVSEVLIANISTVGGVSIS
jgi:hypothetical protein